ncbi:MAG: cbb3-type cytochrome c oxidase subunit I [Armatimonadetes bacterium]|nr:cbb3-type cytochrome c oxidase subunit I [Armatimonadota bacterium]
MLTKDHKRIAVLYLISVTFMFLLGGLAAGLVRLELTSPHGQLFTSEQYNKLFSAHGIVMVFFVIIPGIPAILGNFVLPLMIGARDLAFPRLNLLSWYLYVLGAIIVLTSFILGGVDAGWTFYTPLSSLYSNSQITLCLLGLFMAGFSSILTGLNFVATVHKMRAPGLTWFKMPLFIWAQYATSLIMLLGTPVVAITLVLVILERTLKFGIFSPELGGDPVLFQHLFWFYSHPAVYIMILPSMGVISELVACFSRRRVFGYEFVAFSSIGIAAIGFLIWGHHMYISSQSTLQNIVFSLLTLIVAVPSAVKTFNWSMTMYKGSVQFTTPMVYVFGFLGLFLVGGLTGPYLGAVAADVHLTGTYFVVAHFHYIMVGGAIMGLLGGLHFWWPKMFGKMYSEFWGKLTALVVFVGFNFTFFPQFILGYLGMPRRYHYYYFAPEWQVYNIMSTAGATVLGIGYLLPMFYLTASLIKGKDAGPNPWGAKGIEWEHADSPPDPHNFHHTVVVTEPPYNYDAIQDNDEFRKKWGAPPVTYKEDNV